MQRVARLRGHVCGGKAAPGEPSGARAPARRRGRNAPPCAAALTVAASPLSALELDELRVEWMAVEQGEAVVAEVQRSFVRGAVATSAKVLRPGAAHFVMWENLGTCSVRLQPNKSNSVVWLSKAWCSRAESDPACEWPAHREIMRASLPHAQAWIDVLQRAREDGGIDIKDDCRLEDRSALCHQDGNNWTKRSERPLIRLAINVSNPSSGRSLDYFDISADKRFLDGEDAFDYSEIDAHSGYDDLQQEGRDLEERWFDDDD